MVDFPTHFTTASQYNRIEMKYFYSLRTLFILSIAAVGAVLCASAALAQAGAASGATQSQMAALQKSVADAQSSADNAWMLVSAALVLMMTGPGLALFYSGLVRTKNVLGTMMQSFAMMGIITVLWALVSYSLAFGHGSSFVGGFEHLFLRGVGLSPNADYAATIPHQTYMIYQLMFAIITPALITGAFAERMKFSAMCVFLILWSILVYDPMAHMVWGVGGLLNATGTHIHSLDFAGGTVVHITSGVSALICALYLGKRVGYPDESMRPHNLVLSAVGACLLWVGWFGFNAGSAVNAGSLASSAFVATHFGAAAAALGWTFAEWIHNGKPSMLGAISGAVAGLVAITPASGFVEPFPAILIGAAAGVVCFLMVTAVKKKFNYDDALDAFGVHGMGGTLGAILTGVFATKEINDVYSGKPMGWIDGNPGQVLNQATAVAVSWVLAIVGTLIILKVCDLVVGVRATEQDEVQGLDLSMHGEEGYTFES
jgi:Amt family ammonium transporter